MYDIDYVFDEMSLFHIEELFNVSNLQDNPTRLATGKDVKISPDLTVQSGKNQVAGIVFRDLKWTQPTQKSNFMLKDMQKKYGEDIKLHTWYFLKYTVGSSAIEHMHKAFNGEYKGWSTITMLSNPSEYMGGELVIHTRDKEEEIVLKKGQTIRIDDDVVHSVNRVDWGERRTLIHWFKE